MPLTVSEGRDPVVIVCSADAGYVLPLTVMLASVRAHLSARRHLDIHIVDEGIPEPDKTQLRRSLDLDAVTISWHTADQSRLIGVPLWGRLPLCAALSAVNQPYWSRGGRSRGRANRTLADAARGLTERSR